MNVAVRRDPTVREIVRARPVASAGGRRAGAPDGPVDAGEPACALATGSCEFRLDTTYHVVPAATITTAPTARANRTRAAHWRGSARRALPAGADRGCSGRSP